jgi:hypothetical protein
MGEISQNSHHALDDKANGDGGEPGADRSVVGRIWSTACGEHHDGCERGYEFGHFWTSFL